MDVFHQALKEKGSNMYSLLHTFILVFIGHQIGYYFGFKNGKTDGVIKLALPKTKKVKRKTKK